MSTSKISINASDFISLYRPTKCELRVVLKSNGIEEGPVSAYQEVIQLLGERHEHEFLSQFKEVTDLSCVPISLRAEKTLEAIEKNAKCIYQGAFNFEKTIGSNDCIIQGVPDFLIFDNDGYKIVDAKLSRRITQKDHPEIFRQLELYGWLFESNTRTLPKQIMIYSGRKDLVNIEFEDLASIERDLNSIARLKLQSSLPKTPVGWSKCNACTFQNHCWPIAENNRDVSLVPDVDQGLALALYEQGINTYDDLSHAYNETELMKLERPWGNRLQKVGKKASTIIQQAKSLSENIEFKIAEPSLPISNNYVMFDLEGIPPQLDGAEVVYLWGLQVFGEKPSSFIGSVADFGDNGDLEGWNSFLLNANQIFEDYGNIPFCHWHSYERVKINMYIERYGDENGIAIRVLSNLLDLLPIVKSSFILPIPSYSLKVLEKYVGFKRSQNAYGGDWSIAKFIHATETANKLEREELMDEIITYNREDLEATWAVFKWLKSKTEDLS